MSYPGLERAWNGVYSNKGGKSVKAAVWYKKGDIRIESVPEPEVGNHQAKIRVKACGICGSDLHEYLDGPIIIPRKPHPLTNKAGGPVVLGHEVSGEVVDVGAGVTRFRKYDRVVVNPLIYCGECNYCKRGEHIMCPKLGTYGFAADGAFSEYAVFSESSLLKLPDAVTDEMGTFVEPLAVAIHAVRRSRMSPGSTVAVIGAGPIGLLVMQSARACGAGKVFVSEPVKARRDIASETGAAFVFDPTESDIGKEIEKRTDGLRADISFDCVGSQESFDAAVRMTGRRRVICIVGLALKPIEVPFVRLWGHEKELTFSSGYEGEFPTAIAFLEDKRVDVERLISSRIRLDDVVAKGIKPLLKNTEKNIKILVCP
jgi:(R,R)-butanediol dehydrogenase/meso-butanediol dehydrogenase/diacetyl reductase